MDNPIKMDDLGVPLFSETLTYRIVAVTLSIHVKYQPDTL